MKFLAAILLFLEFSPSSYGQGKPNINDIIPNKEIQRLFAKQYFYNQKIGDGSFESETCEIDSLPIGATCLHTEWTPVAFPNFYHIAFWLIKKVGNEILLLDGKTMNTSCLDSPQQIEYFLVGINSRGQMLLLSGETLLNNISNYFSSDNGIESIAAIRLAYLLPVDIKHIRKIDHWITYSAKSKLLGNKIYIQIYDLDVDRFQIWKKSQGKWQSTKTNLSLRTNLKPPNHP